MTKIDEFISYKQKHEYITSIEEVKIREIISECIEKNGEITMKFNYSLIPKKMDESRRVFICNYKDKIFLQYINYIIRVSLDIKTMSCNDIIKDLQEKEVKYNYLKKIDMSKYFDTIDREKLTNKLNNKLSGSSVEEKDFIIQSLLSVFRAMDNCNYTILEKEFSSCYSIKKSQIKIGVGIPQGLPIANILSVLYIDDIKREDNKEILYKYVDDIFLLSNYKRKNLVKQELVSLGLKINTDKSKSILKENILNENILGYSISYCNIKKHLVSRPSRTSLDRQYKKIREIKRQLNDNANKKEYLKFVLELQITGYTDGTKSLGWVNYFKSITDLSDLILLDKYIAKNLKSLNITKKYVRSLHCTRNIKLEKNRRYLEKSTNIQVMSVEYKKQILISYFGSDVDLDTNSKINRKFEMLYYKQLKTLEEDFGRKS